MRGLLVHLTCIVVLTLAMVGAFAEPASARTHVFLGFGGYAPYAYAPYPYAYPYPAYGPYYYPYRAYDYVDAPPPGWVSGHWSYRTDRSGRRIRVWVPGHLR